MKKQMKRTFSVSALVIAALAGRCFGGSAGDSAEITVTVNRDASLVWKTVTSTARAVSLLWPDGAVKASFKVRFEGKDVFSRDITDTSVEQVELDLPVPQTGADEKVYSLSVAYYGADGAEISSLSARLGNVVKTGVASTVRCLVGEDRKWGRLEERSAVLPVPQGADSLTIGEETFSDVDSPGWFCWRPAVGTYALAAGDSAATVEVRSRALMMILR